MENQDTNEFKEVQVMPSSAIESMERAQVDVQIATARKYPRVLSQVKARMLSFATLDEETAASCFYTLPARKGGDGKALQGPSVRLAEIALASYQHIKAGSRVIADDGKMITAQSVVHDLENNVSICIEVQRRVTTREGRRYSDDMVVTTANAACSIALRNAIFRVVPRALITPVYDAARKLAVGDAKSITVKRAAVVDRLIKMGAKKEDIMKTVEAATIEDIDLAKLETLIGLGTSIKDGVLTIEEAFCPKDPKPDAPKFKKVEKGEGLQVLAIQDGLAAIVQNAGFNLGHFNAFVLDQGESKVDFGTWDDVPEPLASKMVNAKAGLIAGIKAMEGGVK
jgi:hypothetical protein